MTILVLGGSGAVGRPLVEQLVAEARTVRAVARSWPQAIAGAECAAFDLCSETMLTPLLADVTAVFVSLPFGPAEFAIAGRLVAALVDSSVQTLVHLSVMNAELLQAIPHFASKIAVERLLRSSGRELTILQSNHFFQNDLRFVPGITGGLYPLAYGPRGVNAVDARDVATAAANALNDPAHFAGNWPIAGDDCITGRIASELYEKALGYPVQYIGDAPADWDGFVARHMAGLPDWLAADMAAMWQETARLGCPASDEERAASRTIIGGAPRRYPNFVRETAAAWSVAAPAARSA